MKNQLTRLAGRLLASAAILAALLTASLPAQAQRMEENYIDAQWKFQLGDTPDAANPNFDDSAWRTLDLPHDWSIEGEPLPENPAGNDGGYYPTGIGWYRKTLDFTEEGLKDRLNLLYFEGVYMNAEVFVNGHSLGKRPYGYSSFWMDASPYWKTGKNVLAVRVDNSRQKNCRWYTGSGIYRSVRLVQTPLLHFAPWGIAVRSTVNPDGSARICAEATLTNSSTRRADFTLNGGFSNTEDDWYGHQESHSLEAGETRTFTMRFDLPNPRLWSTDDPNLYTLQCSIGNERGEMVDFIGQTFGIRSIDYDARQGLRLNGKPIELNGACLHHDNGPLGAAAYPNAERRKARLLKEAGFNAVRTAHNPPSEAFLNACDELGLLVIDEAFDGWRTAKNTHDYSNLFDRWWREDIESMVLRDRNHPSIFCWSIGNEIIERKSPEAVLTAYALAGHVRRLDPTRPVTSALAAWDSDWEIYDPLAAAHDIVGYNYMMHKGPSDHQRVPDRVMMQTESYPRDAFANWERVADHPYIIGDFVWTGIDYLGESGIGRYFYQGETEGEHYQRDQFPWHGAYCGDIDLTGWRKPISHYRELLYNPQKTLYMAVKEPNGYHGQVKETQWSVWPTWESWNWPGHEGLDIEVEVYSRHPAVRLYLDNRLIGEQPTTRQQAFKAVFTLPYEPGILRAAGVKNGVEVESVTLATAGNPAAIRLTADNSEAIGSQPSLVYITAEVIDRHGQLVPDADPLLNVAVSGPATLIATCSADLKDRTPYPSAQRKAWKGRALIVLKTTGEAGTITVTARAKGLKRGTLLMKNEE